MNLILERSNQVPYFTEMGSVFNALKISARNYDWYLSDLEINHNVPGFTTENQWITGEDFHRLITEQKLQFIWGVFSAFPIGFRCFVESAPFADGNPAFWANDEYRPQLKNALFEIISWDSSATLLVGLDAETAANFSVAYPDAKPLKASPAPHGSPGATGDAARLGPAQRL